MFFIYNKNNRNMIINFKLFESAALWNNFIDKVNKGIILKDEPDFITIDKLSNLIPNGSKVLDISIGDGVNTEYLIEKGFDVYGSDISDLAIDTIKNKYPNNTWIVHDTLQKFPFNDKFFNLIFARLSLHYFEINDIEKVLLDINRMLKDNGYLYILVKTSNTGAINTGKISYTSQQCIEIVSNIFNIYEHKQEIKKVYNFEKESSMILEIIAKK
jgi:ubiquinone/menaquinone biosynthesis C-methylase UbiE